jgi:hypothetical protein
LGVDLVPNAVVMFKWCFNPALLGEMIKAILHF